MNTKPGLLLVPCVALLLSACGSGPRSLIVGKWEMTGAKVSGAGAPGPAAAGRAIRMTAVFGEDGTATMTMFGKTLQGTYKLNSGNQLEWTMNGITTKARVHVTETGLAVTDVQNRTITYRRK